MQRPNFPFTLGKQQTGLIEFTGKPRRLVPGIFSDGERLFQLAAVLNLRSCMPNRHFSGSSAHALNEGHFGRDAFAGALVQKPAT